MTDTEIDILSGQALDAAIAQAMEPVEKLDAPDAWGPIYSPGGWWSQRYDKKSIWVPRRFLNGNIAMDLIDRMAEWEHRITIEVFRSDHFAALSPNEVEEICIRVDAPSFSLVVARLFLRIARERKP